MSEEQSDVVEIEAIGLEEWDRDRHTPRAMDENLAALVKQSASAQSGPVAAPKLDEGWDDGAEAKPRTTTNTLRRTGAVPAMPDPKRKTQAFGVAVQRPAAPVSSGVPKTVAAVQTKPIAREATAAQKPIEKAPAAPKPPVATPTKTSPALTPVATKAPAQPVAAKPTKTSPALTPVAQPATKPAAAKPAENVKPATKASAELQAIKPAATTSSPKPATKASTEMQAIKPATKASAEIQAIKPAAMAKPPAPPAKASAEIQAVKPAGTKPVAAKPSSELVAAKPVAKEPPPAAPVASPTPVAKSSSEMSTLKPATPVAKSSSEMATLKAQGPMQLPVWPPKPEQAYEDWDDPNAATSIGTSTSPPSGDWDGPRESSVIVDLNAVAARSEAPRRAQTSPITQLTSEQGTTTSGAFVMPVAPVGKGSQPETAIAASGGSFETLTAPMAPSAASFETVTAPGLSSAVSFETVTAPGGGRAPTPMPFAFPLAPPPAEPAPQRAERALSPELERASSPQLGARAAAWQTPLPQALPHAPPATFPSAAGLDYHGGDAVPAPIARHEPTEPRIARSSLLAAVLPTPKSRRFAVIGAAAAGVLIVVGFAVAGGSSSKPAPIATKDKATAAASHDTTAPTSGAAPASSQPAAAAKTRVAVATPTDRATTTTDAPTMHPTPGKKMPAKRRLSRGKKPVVVDYDKQRDPTPDPDQALAQARTAYAAGNQHLFAGEAAAAVTSYRQALAVYPGYVAGYRGLGLAFAQAGDRKAALDAFKTYVKLAPAAKDVALIEKRIRNLSVAH